MQIRTIRKGFEVSNANSNHSKGIRSIRMQILTIQTKFEAVERDSKHSNANSNHSKEIGTIRKGFEAFECKF